MMKAQFTAMGTPCSAGWDEAWVGRVEAEEHALGTRICGARLKNGEPCRVSSTHASGRCVYHGGCEATGAQPGNRNAVVHGLYARGLQRCGAHCPMWKHCPLAQAEVMDLPEKHRPECPYEVQHFEATLGADGNAIEEASEGAQLVVLLKVMMLRAATAMSVSPMFVTDEKGNALRVHPAVDAFRRLSGEYLRHVRAERRGTGTIAGKEKTEEVFATESTGNTEGAGGKIDYEGTSDYEHEHEGKKEKVFGAKQEVGTGVSIVAAVEERTTARADFERLSAQAKDERRRWGRAGRVTREQLAAAQQRLARAG